MTPSTPSFEDRTDFENADRGFIATLDPVTIVSGGRARRLGPRRRTPSWTATARTR